MAAASSNPRHSTAGQVRIRDLGLTILHEPEEGTAATDVVFVHGLQGHPKKTWTYKPAASTASKFRVGSKKAAQTVFWPVDLLAEDVPNVRILTYGYDSKITHGIHGPANHSNISQHGLSLLNAVSGRRQNCHHRYV